MRHLTDGVLRRLCDDPLALSAAERRHVEHCHACQARQAAIAADARFAAEALMPMASAPRPDTEAALARLRREVAAPDAAIAPRRSRRTMERILAMYQMQRRRLVKPVGGLIAAAALVGALALTPAGSLAQSFITIFEPKQVAALPLTMQDLSSLRSLPNLGTFGTMGQTTRPRFQEVGNFAAARAASGLALLTPATLPAGIPSQVTYEVASPGTASFTFSAAKAAAAARAGGQALPAMPAGLDGSTLEATVGPAVAVIYGGSLGQSHEGAGHGRRVLKMGLHGLPTLVIGEAAVPRVTSTGASVGAIEDYLLKMPGISPTLAGEIRAIGDPSSTLPIPIPVDRANAQSVQVQGVSGLAVGDNTGIASVVVWQKNHMVFVVGGMLTQDQALSIANALQ